MQRYEKIMNPSAIADLKELYTSRIATRWHYATCRSADLVVCKCFTNFAVDKSM